MSQSPPNPDLSGVRRALRERDAKTLGALVASQLIAYRCSTVYGPSVKVMREVIDEQALPRLEAQHEVRRVVVRAWGKAGPTLAELHAELLGQLELAPPAEPGSVDLAAVVRVVERAHRVSDRPLVIVLYELERMLDDGRDRRVDQRFVDALAALVDQPIRGLQLVMAVQEQDLGAFRHLLRGRQRLLANDLRLHSDDRRLIIPIGVIGNTTAQVAAGAGKGGIIAAIAGGVMGVAGVILAAVGLSSMQDAEKLRSNAAKPPPAVECPVCEDCPECPAGPGTDPRSNPTQPADPVDGTTTDAAPDATAGPTPEDPPDAKLPAVDPKTLMCTARKTDGACAACTRAQCCKELQACRSAKWRNCLLQGKVHSEGCQPDMIESGCRSLATCALEYKCNKPCVEF